MKSNASYLSLALEIAQEVGNYLVQAREGLVEVFEKEKNHFGTNIDVTADKMYLEFFQKHCPEVSVFSEEGSRDLSSLTWVIDPLDGTSNYRSNSPYFATQLCLLRDDVPHVSVIYIPLMNNMLHAVYQEGAWLNGKRLSKLSNQPLGKSLVSISRGGSNQNYIDIMQTLINEVATIRIYGSTGIDLALVAMNSIQLAIAKQTHMYDILPGALIVKEAGGIILDLDSSPYTINSESVIAGTASCVNEYFHSQD